MSALDVLTHGPERSRAPNHLTSRHDDSAATAKLHQVDFLIGRSKQHEVRHPVEALAWSRRSRPPLVHGIVAPWYARRTTRRRSWRRASRKSYTAGSSCTA